MIIEVVLVLALGTGSFTTDVEVMNTFSKVQEIYAEELGIELRIKRYVKRRNPFPKATTLTKRETLLRRWEGYFKRRRNTAVIKFAITPPLTDAEGRYWLAGFASATCAYRRLNPIAYAVGEPVNHLGQDRRLHSAYAIAHEAGHLLGANHVWACNGCKQTIMHPAALAYLEPQGGVLHFAQQSIDSIARCLD